MHERLRPLTPKERDGLYVRIGIQIVEGREAGISGGMK